MSDPAAIKQDSALVRTSLPYPTFHTATIKSVKVAERVMNIHSNQLATISQGNTSATSSSAARAQKARETGCTERGGGSVSARAPPVETHVRRACAVKTFISKTTLTLVQLPK